jgi:hypothetical protein
VDSSLEFVKSYKSETTELKRSKTMCIKSSATSLVTASSLRSLTPPSRSADQISQLDKRLSDQEEKISRLYNLHGKMLERMDRIDTTQSKHADELAGAASLPPSISSLLSQSFTELSSVLTVWPRDMKQMFVPLPLPLTSQYLHLSSLHTVH